MGAESNISVEIEDLLEHASWARALARRLVVDHATADDLVQETWLAALRSPPRHGRNLRGWIGRLIRNFARRRHRDDGIRKAHEDLLGEAEPVLPPDELIIAVEVQGLLGRMVLSLEEPYRTTVLERYYRGLNSSEIARRQGIAPGTVRWRLSRALDDLRTRLDDESGGDRAAWSLLLIRFAPTDSTALPTGSTILGWTTMTIQAKLALSAVLLACLLLAARFWLTREHGVRDPGGASVALATPAEEDRTEIEIVTPGPDSPGRVPVTRSEGEPNALDAPLMDRALVVAWQRIRVISPEGQRVPGCAVSVAVGDHALELVTDASGLCGFELADGARWTLTARNGDRARSGEITDKTFFGRLGNPQDVQLYELVRVRGRVLLADGSPAAGARVSAELGGFVMGRGTPEGAESTATSDGSFELSLEAHRGSWEFRAEWRELQPCTECVTIPAGTEPVVVLRFPGEQEWSGLVVDPSGEPIEGARVHVVAARRRESGESRFARQELTTDHSGVFRSASPPTAPFLLIAEHADWSASDPLELAPGLPVGTRPVLRLVVSTEISGRVTWEDGRPAAGALLASYLDYDDDAGDDLAVRAGHDVLLYPMARTESESDGRFRLSPVRSGSATYIVECLPDMAARDRSIRLHEVAPGTTDLEVILSEALLRGSVLRATVKREDTGVPLEEIEWILYHRREDGRWWQEGGVRRTSSKEGWILREGLDVGESYAMAVFPIPGYAAALIDPWTAGDREHVVDALLRVPVQVQLAVQDFTPGEVPLVMVVPVDPHPHEQPMGGRIAENGRFSLPLWPDRFVAYVHGPDGQRLLETEFEVLPSSDGLVVSLSD